MSDLISRSKLQLAIKRSPAIMDKGKHYVRLDAVLGKLLVAPAVDAVPVVRCKDCACRGSHDLCPMCVRVYQLDESGYLDCTADDGFCHCGAKMDAKGDEESE